MKDAVYKSKNRKDKVCEHYYKVVLAHVMLGQNIILKEAKKSKNNE